MKTLLLAGAVLAAAGCQSESAPAIRVPTPNTSTGPDQPSRSGPVDPAADMPEPTTVSIESPPPSITSTTVAPEPITCPGYGHPLHHLSCAEAAAAVARRAPVDYDVPSPQARSVGRGTEPAGGDGPCGGSLPPCSVMGVESGGDPNAVNATGCGGRGCYGKWQFDPRTSQGLGYSRPMNEYDEATQDEAARALWAGGSGCSHWNAC